MSKKNIFSRVKHKAGKAVDLFLSSMQDIALKKIDNNYLAFSDILNIYGYDKEDKCAYLSPNNLKPLYGVNISSHGSFPESIDNLSSLMDTYSFKDDSQIMLFYSKTKATIDESNTDFCTNQNIYLYTFSRGIAEDISSQLDTGRMSIDELLQSLFDIGMISNYENDRKDLMLKSNIDVGNFKLDDMFHGFKTMFGEGVYKALNRDNDPLKSNYTLYQGLGTNSSFSNNRPNLHALFAGNWHGYIGFYFDFSHNHIKGHIKDLRWQTKTFEPDTATRDSYRMLAEGLDDETLSKLCITNTVALIDNPLAINNIKSILNTSFIEKAVHRKKLLYGTLLKYRDTTFDGLGYIENIQKFIKSIHKKQNSESRTGKDFYGRDISGNYTSYSFSETGESLHWSVVAPSRSGKTVFVLKTITQVLGAKISPKTQTELAEQRERDPHGRIPLDKIDYCGKIDKANIVQFDVGKSGEKLITEIERTYPDKVSYFRDNVNVLRLGLTNIGFDYETGKAREEDILFSISIVSLILEMNDSPKIDALERAEIKEAFERVFSEDKYTGLTLKELKEIGGYEKVIDSIKNFCEANNDTFDLYKRTTEYNLRGTDLDFIQKPILGDILKELKNKSGNIMVDSKTREYCEQAYSKLSVVKSDHIFCYYSSSNIEKTPYFYMELETLKGLGEKLFVPVFISIFYKIYRRDILRAKEYAAKDMTSPKVFYIIEEAHNFIHMESLVKMFDVIFREASRYGIHLCLITQGANDIPEKLLDSIGTRVVMPSVSISGDSLKNYWKRGDEDKDKAYMDFYSQYSRKYYAFVNYGKGLLTINHPMSDSEERIFNSNFTQGENKEEETENEVY